MVAPGRRRRTGPEGPWAPRRRRSGGRMNAVHPPRAARSGRRAGRRHHHRPACRAAPAAARVAAADAGMRSAGGRRAGWGRWARFARPALALLIVAAVGYAVVAQWPEVAKAITGPGLAQRGARLRVRGRRQPVRGDVVAGAAGGGGVPAAAGRGGADLPGRPAGQVPARQRLVGADPDGAGPACGRATGPHLHRVAELGRALALERTRRRADRGPGAPGRRFAGGLGAVGRAAGRARSAPPRPS